MQRSYLAELLIVGLGGFLGAAARYALSGLTHRLIPFGSFPWGTLAVNLLGCLAIGFLGGVMELRQSLGSGQRLFLLIGVLGGFTTYSSFAYETLALARAAELARAGANVLLHVAVGMAAAWLGFVAARYL